MQMIDIAIAEKKMYVAFTPSELEQMAMERER